MFSPPLLAPSKEGLSLPFTLDKTITYLNTQLKGELTENGLGVPYFHRQGRNTDLPRIFMRGQYFST